VHEVFAEQAACRPDAVAVVCRDERVGYRTLERRANRLANELAAAGVRAGEFVGVHLPRGVDMVVGVLAVLKAGAGYTMLDPAFPAARRTAVARLASVRTVVSDVPLDGFTTLPVSRAEEPAGPGRGVDAEDVACVMFTSGSTGTPKAIASPHRAITATILGQDYAELGPGRVWLQCAPVSWDMFAMELFAPLLTGGTCVLQPGQSPEPARIAELVAEHGVDTLHASASLLNFLIDEHPAVFPGLRQVLTGGEAASVTHLAALLRDVPDLRVVNGYSPAESMIFTCVHRVTSADRAAATIPVGRPVRGKRVFVLDDRMAPVAPGTVGELYMAGAGLAHGYVGDVSSTARAFLPNPFGEPGTRLYRTGDLVRERADGVLEFLGRADDQVKIRGFRVEPAEVAAVLTRHEAVSRAAVVAREDRPGDKRLVAYVVGDVSAEELRTHVAGVLPEHLVPAAFVRLDALPMTANGKLDRGALPAPEVVAGTGRAPATAAEKLLCGLFADVLGVLPVSADDDFLALGGHSLLAAKIVGRLWEHTGVALSLRAVFDARTPAGLARLMTMAPDAAPGGIPRHTGHEPVPLSPLQSGLWLADRTAPDTAEYLIPVLLRIRGPLDLAALRAALTRIVERHEPLRTRVVDRDGPYQVVDPAAPVDLPVVELTGDLEPFVESQVDTPVDLAAGPVFRAVVGRISAREHVLLLCVHHIAADDWSLTVLADELDLLYAGAELPGLPVTYADVALWQRGRDGRLDYWRARLAGMPDVLELPTDRPRPKVRDLRGDHVGFTVPAGLVTRLAELGRTRGASLFMVLTAAFQVLVAGRTGMRDFGIGTPVADRDHPDLDRLVGYLVNLVVLRADLTGEPTFTELLDRVRETTLAAFDHRAAPFDEVVEELRPRRELSRNPLVQVVFALRTAASADWRLADLDVEVLPAHTGTSKFDLVVALDERADGGLAGSVEYPVALYERATVERLAEDYLSGLAEVVAHPEVPLAGLPVPPALTPVLDRAREHVAPRTPTEQAVAEIWSDVLGVDTPGVHDDFFDVGGHSMLAAKVVVRLRKRWSADLGIRAVFRSPTIAALAAEVDAAVPGRVETVPAHHGDLPLSPAQAGLWFADRLTPGSAEYLICRVLRLTGELDVPALRAALTTVVARHAALRTRFVERAGGPVQVVDEATAVDLPVVDVTDEDAFARSHVDTPVDLAAGPLFRASLGRLSATEHLFVLSWQHIVADGWSVRLVAGELADAYAAYRDGRVPALPEPGVRFSDYAAWLAGREVDLAYWRERLAGMPRVVELPADRPRPPVRDARGELCPFAVPDEVARRVVELARRRGVTPFMVLLAAFQVLVRRYTGLRDFGIGTPVAGRDHPDVQRVVGHFVNTVVLRADLTGDPGFRELLDRVRDDTLAAFDHQDVPFDRVIEDLHPDRDPARHPLVQLVFSVDSDTGETWALSGVDTARVPLHSGTSKFDLLVVLRERRDGTLTGTVEYPTALFDRVTVERLAGHYVTLLAHLVEEPERPVDRVPMLPENEWHHLVRVVNDTAVARPAGETLHGLVEEQAARTPDATAAVHGEVRLSYAELDRWANGIAHVLAGLGVRPDVPVGVRVDRSPALMAALLGVLKAGGCYVPVETDAPPARVLAILSDANAPVCLVDGDVPVGEGTLFVRVPVSTSDSPPAVAVDPDHLVSVYYTSGSTGRPKGVASTHRGWVNRMRWMQDTYRLRPDEVVLQKTTLVFDDSAVECFWPLLVGASVALVAPGLHRDPAAIRDAAIRHRVAVLQFVPSMLTLFLECLEPGHGTELDALRHVVSSGEALPPELLRSFLDRLGHARLHNQWGATEVSIDSTARHCAAEDTRTTGPVSVGSPIANNEVHVLDEHLAPVPAGVLGDLYIGGVGLARGYHADPARTAAAFLPSPFGDGERLYRTGDRGTRARDGSIMFAGRQDDQVKIRGIRVEPGEVEQVMLALPGVRAAAVTVWTARAGDKRLAGYAVARPGAELTVAGLRAALRERLPGYLVPAALMVVPELPTTPSGKVDRQALPAPTPAGSGNGTSHRVPEGPVAERIAEIWAEVLDVPRVGADDNFFDLGGHSLLATRAVARMRAAFDADVPLSLLFRAGSLTELAAAVTRILPADRGES
jgi:amino acid adenylation domain-containing protein